MKLINYIFSTFIFPIAGASILTSVFYCIYLSIVSDMSIGSKIGSVILFTVMIPFFFYVGYLNLRSLNLDGDGDVEE